MRAIIEISPEAQKKILEFLKRAQKEGDGHDVIFNANSMGVRVTCGDMVPLELRRL